MDINRKNMMDYNFFREKRLVFLRDKDASGAKNKGESAQSRPKLTPAGTAKKLRELSEEIASETFTVNRGPTRRTHTGPALTRTLTPTKPSYKESAEIADQAISLEGQLDSKETEAMQLAHKKLYAQYMNPAFMLHLKRSLSPEKKEAVYQALSLVVNKPNEFSYEFQHDKTLHIVKRHPLGAASRDTVPNDFKVVMEPSGNVVEVAGVPLTVDGKVPWMENDEYNKNAPLYESRWTSELAYYLYGDRYKEYKGNPVPADVWEKIIKESFGEVTESIKDIHVTMNIDFPQRLANLVKARNLEFEKTDPQIMNFLSNQTLQGTTYDAITKNGYGPDGGLRLMVVANPKYPGIYEIITREFAYNPLVVSYEGYIMRPTEDGKGWEPDVRYGEAVRRRYYKDHQKAWEHGGLTPEAKQKMEEVDGQEKPNSAAATYAEKMTQWRVRREAVDAKLDGLCKYPTAPDYNQQLQTLRNVAKQVSINPGEENPTHPNRVNRERGIDQITDPGVLKIGIEEILDEESMNVKTLTAQTKNDRAASVLGGIS